MKGKQFIGWAIKHAASGDNREWLEGVLCCDDMRLNWKQTDLFGVRTMVYRTRRQARRENNKRMLRGDVVKVRFTIEEIGG